LAPASSGPSLIGTIHTTTRGPDHDETEEA
jgi:hypothetical protein